MKLLANIALMLSLGFTGLYAQSKPVKMTLSGTAVPSTINLGAGAFTSDYQFGGNGTLGPFTFRSVSASGPSTQPPSTCPSPKLYGVTIGGAGVFRFQDGSLLKVHLIEGSDCLDFAALEALCIRVFQVTGGTGRFQAATGGMITLTENIVAVPAGPTSPFAFSAITADATGTVAFTVGAEAQEDAQR
jgi:hypothetical protein